MKTMTVKKMRAAIKDYCREVCPNIGSVILEPKHIHVKKYDDEEWGILFPYAVGWVGVSSMGEGDAAFLYAALGLETRDAIAAERAKVEEAFILASCKLSVLLSGLEEVLRIAADFFVKDDNVRYVMRETARGAIAAYKEYEKEDQVQPVLKKI